MTTYLVTGGTGFIGSAIVRQLCKTGHYVTVLDNNFKGDHHRLDEVEGKFNLITGDIRDSSVVNNAAKNIDSIIHLAYINGTPLFYSNPNLVLEVAIKGMLNVLEACKQYSISELFLASSSEVYQTPTIIPTPENVPLIVPDPHNPRYSYGGGKILSELLSLHWKCDSLKRVIIFRPHNVYGPDMGTGHVVPDLILKLLNLTSKQSEESISLPIQGTGLETRSFVHINDFVQGFMALIEKGQNKEIYNIGTEEEVTINDLIKSLGLICNRKINIESSEAPKGETSRRCPDISKIRKLGYEPKVSLIEGLEDTYAWYRANRHRFSDILK